MTERKTTADPGLIYSIEETSKTPFIYLDANNGIIKIAGKVMPENPDEFFGPILRFIDEHFDKVDPISCEVKLVYFNSPGSKMILTIFRKLDQLFLKGVEISSKWYYEEDDEDVMSEGEDLQHMVKLPIELLEIAND